MAALSPQAPTRPMDPTMWCRPSAPTNSPASKLRSSVGVNHTTGNVTAAGDGVVEGGDGEADFIRLSMEEPTIRLEYTSLNAHRYSLPSPVQCSVMSPIHNSFGFCGAVNSRRSGPSHQ